jgi:beta-glucosidase
MSTPDVSERAQFGVDDEELTRADFGEDFTWGVATAAYQIEGGWDADGKGPSIWDTFTHSGKHLGVIPHVRDHSTGDVACDFYHRHTGDVALVADLGFGANRFSTSWPRVLPEGTGRVNQAGLDFYSRVVDECLEVGVEPWITLYHWDLPQALQDRGGWTNRDVVGWFADYAAVMGDALGDRVTRWMVFNEPLSFTIVGHLLGAHAPGIRSRSKFLAAVHHTNLAQASGAAALRSTVPAAAVGTTQYFAPIVASGDTALHRKATVAADALINRLFLEPNLGLGYPTDECGFVRPIERYVRAGDDAAVQVEWDFLGAQYYTRFNAPLLPIPGLWTAPMFGRDVRHYEVTATGWEVQPDGLYDVLERLHGYGRFGSIVVTENGAAFPDRLEGDRVRDPRRVEFYRQHLVEVRRAVRAGVPVDGYFCWSLMDNFEWADGYEPRFGITYVDYPTQRRVVKDSGRWFQSFLAGD